MLTTLVPVQEKIYAEFGRLASIYESEALNANQTAASAVKSANKRILFLLGFVTLLCIFIATNVSRRIYRSEQALRQHRDDLEIEVENRTAELANEIQEREYAQKVAQKESKRLAVTLASIGDAVVTITSDNIVEYLNPEAERLLHLNRIDVMGKPVDAVLKLTDHATGETLMILASDTDTDIKRDAVLHLDDATNIDIQRTVATISDEEGTNYGSVIVLRDVSESTALSRKLSHEAKHDSLTGLVNRREFERRLANAIEAVRNRESSYTLCYIDLDKFKAVNDTAGHGAGDNLLREISETLNETLRETDVLARIGGDEFGLLLSGCDLIQGTRIAENLLQKVKNYRLIFNEQTFSVGASIGVISIPEDTADLESLLSMADAACYTAKKKGRNCVNVFRNTDTDIISVRDEANMAGLVRSALSNGNYELHSQKIVGINAENEGTNHHEILIRMKSQDGNLIYPMAFLPAAERYGLLPAIDKYVINEIFAWIAAGRGMDMSGRFSINLSGSSLSDPDFLKFVQAASTRHEIKLDQIIFEVTESVAISNLSAAVKFMDSLSSEGCEFALDDFGKGFSSLTNLKELPVDYLKIDGDFVKDILTNPTDEATVRAINELGHPLGIRTVAEFVESMEICERLKDLGVDFAQGYALSRPSKLLNSIEDSAPLERIA